MEKKQLQKLSLNKEVVSRLTPDEQNDVRGGWVSTITECTHWLCCDTDTLTQTSCFETDCCGESTVISALTICTELTTR